MRRTRARRRIPTGILAAIGLLLLAAVPATSAVLADAVSMSRVTVTAGTVEAPTGLAVDSTGSSLRLTWSAPATGIPPHAYEIYRRAPGDSYADTPTATSAASPWSDDTRSECTSWAYRVRAKHENLTSAFSGEVTATVDGSAPTVSAARVVFTGGPVNVADYVRSSGGSAEVYATVSDNCAAAGSLSVAFDLTGLGAGTVAGTYGSWTPIGGGPTYNYRATFPVASGVAADGTSQSWSVSATDTNGNDSGPITGTPVIGDGLGPVFARAVMVSAYTNYYDAASGTGEIPSDGGARDSGSYVYADFSDAGSGVESATADLAAGGLLTGGSAVALAAGNHTTYGRASTWGWRSPATTISTGLADGARDYTVTATDRVGNPPTISSARSVEVDDTPFAAATASCANAGDADDLLDAGDTTDIVLGDTIFPGSIKASWDGGALTATAVLRNAAKDFFDVNTDFGVSLMRGTTSSQAYNLNAGTWVTADVGFPGSTLALASPGTLRLTYQGASVTDRASIADASIGTAPRDAAGNPVSAAFTVSCSTGPW